jgi:glutamine synthetase
MARKHPLAWPTPSSLDKPAAESHPGRRLKVIGAKGIERITFHYTAIDGAQGSPFPPPIAITRRRPRRGRARRRVVVFKGMVDMALSTLRRALYRSAFFNPFTWAA